MNIKLKIKKKNFLLIYVGDVLLPKKDHPKDHITPRFFNPRGISQGQFGILEFENHKIQ